MKELVAVVALSFSGCLTFSGEKLADIAPPPSKGSVTVEFGFRDFDYSLDGGALSSSASMAETINENVARTWSQNGYASRSVQRGRNQATGASDYTLTLTGNLDGDSSVVLQVISGLTLLLIPHTIDAHAFFVFELKRTRDGAMFKATVAEDVNQVTWLPFILGLPWMNAGADHAMKKMALHIYDQFAAQGAFEQPASAGG